MNEDVLRAAKTIWDWLPSHDAVKQADMIYVLGNKSDALPVEAAKLFKQQLAPWIVVCGGYGRLTKNDSIAEADRYMKTLQKLGVSEDVIIPERQSTNTGENILFAQKVLADRGHNFKKAIAITTPILSRRHRATLKKQWPSIQWMIHTPTPASFEERMTQANSQEFLDLLAGEVDRLQKYPSQGFMEKVDVPQNILAAQKILIAAGHTKHLVPPVGQG